MQVRCGVIYVGEGLRSQLEDRSSEIEPSQSVMVHFTVLTLWSPRVSELHRDSLVGRLRCLRGFGRKCEIFLSECLLILCLRG